VLQAGDDTNGVEADARRDTFTSAEARCTARRPSPWTARASASDSAVACQRDSTSRATAQAPKTSGAQNITNRLTLSSERRWARSCASATSSSALSSARRAAEPTRMRVRITPASEIPGSPGTS
jgi:hypothetical protein